MSLENLVGKCHCGFKGKMKEHVGGVFYFWICPECNSSAPPKEFLEEG